MDHEEHYSNQQEEEEEEEVVDVFDLLPDALVLEIFNRVEDARSLSACTILCKRFGDLVTQTHNVSLEITRRNKVPEVCGRNSGLNLNKSKGFLGRFVLNPIHSFLNRMNFRKLKSKTCSNCSDDDDDEEEGNSFRLPNELLNSFKEIRSLAVKLPGLNGDISSENGSGALLKWKAEFGKELESCVILGATGFQKSEVKLKNRVTEIGKNGEISSLTSPSPATIPANLTNKQLKKRVVWTISCLIASSARHHMLKQIISSNRTIKDVKISDGSKQGTIEMTEKQVADLREDMNSTAAIATETVVVEPERTKVPAVTIKMWYLPVVELPESGCVMKGATLAVIRPAAAVMVPEKDDDVSLAMGAFEEKFIGEAVRKLIDRKKSYTLEMNSF